jgi:branched-subunit amino acid aminotransferase/4-amino-4-deoxychorismate lyase
MEVLLWNPSGNVMDGSLPNVYFYRNGRWVAPPLSSGGQAETARRWVLENGMAVETAVTKDEIVTGEVVLLSNSVRGILAVRVV